MKYILTKLGISNLDNNNENIKKSFYINNSKNIRAPIELPIKYYCHLQLINNNILSDGASMTMRAPFSIIPHPPPVCQD